MVARRSGSAVQAGLPLFLSGAARAQVSAVQLGCHSFYAVQQASGIVAVVDAATCALRPACLLPFCPGMRALWSTPRSRKFCKTELAA